MSLQEIGLKYGTDKATYHNFLNFYESKFNHLKNKKINLLEIGFLNGSSIKTWLDFFENAQVYCIDIIDADFEHERFHFHKISQDDKNLKNIFKDDFFDIIIDDGSHLTSHQLKSLEFLWSKLKYSGYYIIEDLHTSFRLEYVNTEITPYDILIGKNMIENLISIKNEMSNIEIFKKNENDLTDSMTSIFNKEKSNKLKIIDGFIFYNELKMLELRLKELNDVVDYFVLVESTKTFTLNDKELYFKNNKHKFSNYLHKIIHVIIDNLNDTNPWGNEFKQRDAIHKGISQLNLNEEDLIMISDVDEIPDTDTLKEMKNTGLVDSPHNLGQDMYYYNIKCKYNGRWHYPKICNFRYYSKIKSPQTIRKVDGIIVEKGGWHFSYFGDLKFIKNKIKNFSHQEYNNDEFLDDNHITSVIEQGKDLFKRENQNITYTLIDPKENGYLPKNYEILLN